MSKSSRSVIVKESTARRIIEQSRVRLLCIGLFFGLCFCSIGVRMVDVAVLSNPKAMTITVSDPDEEKSEEIALASEEPVLQRGDIVDRNGVLLATSLMTASVYANPKEIKDNEDTAKELARALSMDEGKLLSRLKSGKSFVWIKRDLAPREEQAVNSLGIPGIYFQPEERRVYPYGNLLSHVIGYVGVDNKGLAGIEQQFNGRLRDSGVNRDPVALSIDVRLQAIMHEEVKRTAEEFQAQGAAGIIMDVKSGEILSMVSLPDFDPHKPGRASDISKFNRATLGVYEMGSTFKTFTMAMALDYGTANMKSGYDASHPLHIGNAVIEDDHAKNRFLLLPEIYAYSSNIGAAKAALDVGTKRQKAFLEKLGMMQQVDIEIPERAAPLYPQDWQEINTVTIAYGHGISVTPLHLVRGVAALVDGGIMPRLTLLKDGNENHAPGVRVVSEQTSKNIRRLMRLVVEHGTGGKANIAGYHVAGKTGTAEKIGAHGAYEHGDNLSSFIATFPMDDPHYVVLVMVDDPKGDKASHGFVTGGWTAAPAVGNIIARMGPLLGIKPRYEMPDDDADKFWVDNSDKPKPHPAANKPDSKYIHVASE